MRRLSRTVRRLGATPRRAALPSGGCWQLGTSEMQDLGSALHQPPAAMTGLSLQCIVTTMLLETLVPARGRRLQVGLQLRLAIAFSGSPNLPKAVAIPLMASPCFMGQVMQ